MRIEDLAAYQVLEKREIADLNSTGFLLTTSAATTLPYTPVLERRLSIAL